MSDEIRVVARLRLWEFNATLGRNIEQAHKRAGKELRDKVKESLNVPGLVTRNRGEMITKGFVIRKGERVDATVRNPLKARKDEKNYDVERSKPGEPPRRQRGKLYKSMTDETKVTPRGVSTRVGPDVSVANKARALELGYEPGGLEARPYLAPAAAAFRPHFDDLIARAIRGATK